MSIIVNYNESNRGTMRIYHVSYSKTDYESTSDFLAKIAKEIENMGEIKIVDIKLDFPEEAGVDDTITATIFYESSTEGDYAMMKKTFLSTGNSEKDALLNANSQAHKWISAKDIILSDVTTSLLLNGDGVDLARVSMYYEEK
jgi:hypothetical protein